MKCALPTLILLGGCLLTACVRAADPPPTEVKIECREESGEYRYFVNDDSSPSSIDDIDSLLRDYARLVDQKAGMRGRDPHTGYSRNPLTFSMAHEAPWTRVLDVVEAASYQRFVDMQVEVVRPDESTVKRNLGWPLDESLGLPRKGTLELRIHERDGRISYESTLYMSGRETEPSSVLIAAGAHKSDWESRPGRAVMKKMARELKEVLGQNVDVVNDMAIVAPGGLHWGEVHFAICVVDELKTVLNRRGEGYFTLRLLESGNLPHAYRGRRDSE